MVGGEGNKNDESKEILVTEILRSQIREKKKNKTVFHRGPPSRSNSLTQNALTVNSRHSSQIFDTVCMLHMQLR